jgi:hypothetical protein
LKEPHVPTGVQLQSTPAALKRPVVVAAIDVDTFTSMLAGGGVVISMPLPLGLLLQPVPSIGLAMAMPMRSVLHFIAHLPWT